MKSSGFLQAIITSSASIDALDVVNLLDTGSNPFGILTSSGSTIEWDFKHGSLKALSFANNDTKFLL